MTEVYETVFVLVNSDHKSKVEIRKSEKIVKQKIWNRKGRMHEMAYCDIVFAASTNETKKGQRRALLLLNVHVLAQ